VNLKNTHCHLNASLSIKLRYGLSKNEATKNSTDVISIPYRKNDESLLKLERKVERTD
jgi:hypothetical protein